MAISIATETVSGKVKNYEPSITVIRASMMTISDTISRGNV